MTHKYTLGPWIGPDENGKFNSNHQWSASNENTSSSESAPVWADGKVIALVVHSSNSFSIEGHPSVTANARLIASAPELLDALQNIIENGLSTSKIAAGKAAIAKATGETTE